MSRSAGNATIALSLLLSAAAAYLPSALADIAHGGARPASQPASSPNSAPATSAPSDATPQDVRSILFKLNQIARRAEVSGEFWSALRSAKPGHVNTTLDTFRGPYDACIQELYDTGLLAPPIRIALTVDTVSSKDPKTPVRFIIQGHFSANPRELDEYLTAREKADRRHYKSPSLARELTVKAHERKAYCETVNVTVEIVAPIDAVKLSEKRLANMVVLVNSIALRAPVTSALAPWSQLADIETSPAVGSLSCTGIEIDEKYLLK